MSISSETYETSCQIDKDQNSKVKVHDHTDKNNNDHSSDSDEAARVAREVPPRAMPGQGPQWTEFLSCEVCSNFFSENANRPISLGCGHTVCKQCLQQLQQNKCPFDHSPITCDIDKLPVNYALLQLIGAAIPDRLIDDDLEVGDISDTKKTQCHESARKCIEELAVYLKTLSEDSINELEKNEDLEGLKVSKQGYQQQNVIQTRGGRTVSTPQPHSAGCVLSRPMQRKLLVLVNCQLVEEEGRSRAARAARSLGERSVTELILAHQNPQQLSANLWAAVRTRGCQFLGPGMQEEVLRLILLALEDGSALSRKVLVLFVVQRLAKQYPQASKTAIGHVVQLLYRASCFKVTKRDEESSLMQLKEEFRGYETLRLEHDAQIVEIAMEAGLRISPEQWSSLLYGDAVHKSHMQSIIDKHQSPQSFTQGINELVLVLQRLGDPSNLCRLRPHLDFLAKIDPSPDCPAPSWEDLEAVMKSLKMAVQGLVDFVKRFNHRRPEPAPPHNTRYKTSMCRDFTAKASCPRGATCTFAHSQEELEQYRCRSKKLSQRGGTTPGMPSTATGAELGEGEECAAQHMDSGAVGLAGPLGGLSVSGSPSPAEQAGGSPQWHGGVSPQAAGPSCVYPVLPNGLPLSHPALHMALGPNHHLPDGLRKEPMAPPAAFPPGMGVRFQSPVPPELTLPYPSAALTPGLTPQPSDLAAVTRATLSLPSGGGGPCLHHQQLAEGLVSGAAASVYSLGPMMGGGVQHLPAEAYLYGQGPGSVPPAVASPLSPMQTLETLRSLKSRLISHLHSERCGGGGDRVASSRARSLAASLSSSVKDSLVATRTTHTLEELESDGLGRHRSSRDPGLSLCAPKTSVYYPGTSGMEKVCVATSRLHDYHSHYTAHQAQTPVTASCDYSRYSRPAASAPGEERRGSVDARGREAGMVRGSTEEEDDFFIPFDPPLVSKFGPICRADRIKLRNTAPVQVTAEERTTMCTQVLSGSAMHRPYPTSAPVPSLFAPQMAARPAPTIPLPNPRQPPPTTVYSPFSGLDFWRRQIPEMVHNLETSAIQANTTSQRLALQLQSVELQISMKTGENPKPVSQLLHEVVPGERELRDPSQTIGNMYASGGDELRMQHRHDFNPEYEYEWK